ncbi:hypothetical protein F5Y13DRAFT_160033 [Hypoxylon sp. FL1857]|nr:hypothetical protein F5Y13DRAFT_160033 [Hypoxylon sp. FL1857]
MPSFSRKPYTDAGPRDQDASENSSRLWWWIRARKLPRCHDDYSRRYDFPPKYSNISRSAVTSISTLVSLLSSVLLGPLFVSFLGLPSPTCPLPALLEKTFDSIPIVVATPRTAQLFLTLHYYCMTTLSLYQISRDRNFTSGVILFLGLAVCSNILGHGGTRAERESEIVAILPLLISLSLLLSASIHSALDWRR